MKLNVKKVFKKITCITLMAGLIITNSMPVSALSTSENEIDFELLADGITAKQKLDAEYAKLGINLDDILALPAREDFQQEGLAYLEEASKNMPVSYAEDTEHSLEAQRIAYAGKMANWSKTKNPSISIEQETIYMYLSHYVDVNNPLDASNGISENSNKGNIWAKYIVDYDRQVYAQYISRGSSKEKFKALTDTMQFVAGNAENFRQGVNFLITLQFESGNKIKQILEAGITSFDSASLLETYKDAYLSGKSVEDTIELIAKQLEPKQGIDNWTIATEFVGLLIAPNPLTLYGMAISFYSELGYNIIDKASFVAMRMYYNFRVIDRMEYKNRIG